MLPSPLCGIFIHHLFNRRSLFNMYRCVWWWWWSVVCHYKKSVQPQPVLTGQTVTIRVQQYMCTDKTNSAYIKDRMRTVILA